MENAVKEILAGMGMEAVISPAESDSKTKRRFSLAKNPANRAAEKGASPKPRDTKRKERSFPKRNKRLSVLFSVKRRLAFIVEARRMKTEQRKITLVVRRKYSSLFFFASRNGARMDGSL